MSKGMMPAKITTQELELSAKNAILSALGAGQEAFIGAENEGSWTWWGEAGLGFAAGSFERSKAIDCGGECVGHVYSLHADGGVPWNAGRREEQYHMLCQSIQRTCPAGFSVSDSGAVVLIPGFLGKYYAYDTAESRSAMFDGFENLNPLSSSIDSHINFRSKSDFPWSAHQFVAQWTGTINITNAGPYSFGIAGDDRMWLWIGEELIVTHGCCFNEKVASVELAAGLHSVRAHLVEHGGAAGIIVRYDGPDTDGWALLSGSQSTIHDFDACSKCPPGSFSTMGASACTPCSPGSYSSINASSSCSLCTEGKASSVSGATSVSVCSVCPAGSYATTGASACTTCSPGSYSSINAASSCSLCIAGKASSVSGATSVSVCSVCPAGTYAMAGATSCTTCRPGSYSNSKAASSCSLCIAGKASWTSGATSVSTCLECPNGTSSATGSSACSVCDRKDVVDRDDGSISTTWSWTGTMCLSVLPGGATHIDALMEDPNVTECLNGPTSDWDHGACECHPQVLLK